MKPIQIAIAIAAIFLATIVADAGSFIVPEGMQAVVTQFGRPIGQPKTEAGFYVKIPFVQQVQFVDRRILTWDGYPNQIPTRDKKYILVDTTARWQIVDALTFIQKVQTEREAQARLDAILDAVTRDTISNHNLVEAVRNSNQILDVIRRKRQESEKKLASGEIMVAEEEEIIGEIEKIQTGREKLSAQIIEQAGKALLPLGINIIDVQLRRIAYETSVEKKVYDRMVSERRRIAEKIRSIGKGEQAKIAGKANRDLQRIESEAYRTSQQLRGNADAQAISIYAASLSQDPKFYAFNRTLEAYRKALKDETHFFLSTDSPFLQYLKKTP